MDAVLAPRYLNVALANASPDKKWFLDEIGDGPVTMAMFSKPFHELGGLFVDFQANRARPLTIRNNVGIQIISAADGSKKPIQIPNGVRVSNAAWSPDGSLIAFYVHTPDATHIWVADPMTGVVEAADAEAGARHARLELRLQRGRQEDRRRHHSGRPRPDAQGPRGAGRPAGQGGGRWGQEQAADVPEPDVHAVRLPAARVARHRAGRGDRRHAARAGAREGPGSEEGAGRDEEDRPAADGARRSTCRPTASTCASPA